MWFVFPQIRGLGHSAMARRYAISSRDEAVCYVAHPVLGPRLEECARLVREVEGCAAQAFFGRIDAMKLRSSMTLFDAVGDNPVFREVLDKYYGGEPDPATLALLAARHGD